MMGPEGVGPVKKRWKILLVCVVALAAIAAWCFIPRSAVGEGQYRIYYVGAGEGLRDITDQVDLEAMGALLQDVERRGYRIGFSPVQLKESSVDIGVLDSSRHWHFYMDEDICVIYDSAEKGGYPIVNSEELLEQVWTLLPKQP